jgi:hypothetical protein
MPILAWVMPATMQAQQLRPDGRYYSSEHYLKRVDSQTGMTS